MERFKYSVSLIIVLALVFVFIGCAKPPDAERSAAQSALDAAIFAGADRYAAASFGSATGLWAAAESRMMNKKYEEAKQNYIAAKSAFEKTMVSTEAAKKAMTDAVNAALPSLENDWKSLEAAATKTGENMEDKKADWAADEKAFTEGLRAAQDMVATNPIGAKAKIDELTSIIDKWDALLNALTPASAKAEVLKKKIGQRKRVGVIS